jgi:hypothetical protein
MSASCFSYKKRQHTNSNLREALGQKYSLWTRISKYLAKKHGGVTLNGSTMVKRMAGWQKTQTSLRITAAFTISPESLALLYCANLPGDLAVYAISVRRLIVLHPSFLRTKPHGFALPFG